MELPCVGIFENVWYAFMCIRCAQQELKERNGGHSRAPWQKHEDYKGPTWAGREAMFVNSSSFATPGLMRGATADAVRRTSQSTAAMGASLLLSDWMKHWDEPPTFRSSAPCFPFLAAVIAATSAITFLPLSRWMRCRFELSAVHSTSMCPTLYGECPSASAPW